MITGKDILLMVSDADETIDRIADITSGRYFECVSCLKTLPIGIMIGPNICIDCP